ncbi:MAG: hypothetical protein ACK43M_15350 [Allorhizobium sp.]
MFFPTSAFRNAQAIDLDDLGGELIAIHELAEEWHRHLFCDEDRDAI